LKENLTSFEANVKLRETCNLYAVPQTGQWVTAVSEWRQWVTHGNGVFFHGRPCLSLTINTFLDYFDDQWVLKDLPGSALILILLRLLDTTLSGCRSLLLSRQSHLHVHLEHLPQVLNNWRLYLQFITAEAIGSHHWNDCTILFRQRKLD
jgi:hypothetical protein